MGMDIRANLSLRFAQDLADLVKDKVGSTAVVGRFSLWPHGKPDQRHRLIQNGGPPDKPVAHLPPRLVS